MAYPVTLNGRTYTLADFEGVNYVEGLPDAFEDFVTHAGDIYNDTSTTSNAIGTGSKTFTVSSGKPYQAGTPLRIADAAAPATNFLDAVVTSYSGTTLVVEAVGYGGSGTKTSWTVNIGGAKTIDGTLGLSQGGTGATTAAAARTNLDTYSKTEADSRFLNVSGEASDVTMTGNVTIGDAAGDTLTVNASATIGSDTAKVKFYSDSTYSGIFNGSSLGSDESIYMGGDTMFFYTSGAERLRLDASGNAILNNSPASTSDNIALRIMGGTAGYSNLQFADSDDVNVGMIQYNHASDYMQFTTNDSEKMRITSGGSVAIGTTSASKKLTVQTSITYDGVQISNTHASSAARLQLDNDNSKSIQIDVGGSTSSAYGPYNANTASIVANSAPLNIGTDSANEIGFYTNLTERMVVSSSGNVGIGVLNPSNKFQVSDSAGGSIASFTNTTSADLSINLTSGVSLISPSTGILAFGTANTERARLDSSGNFFVGTTNGNPTGNHVPGTVINATGSINVHRDGGNPLRVGSSVDGNLTEYYQQGALVGSIGTSGVDLTIGTGDVGLKFNDASNRIDPWNVTTNTSVNGAFDLGKTDRRFKNLYLSGGVYEGYSNVGTHVKTGYASTAFTLSCSPQNSLWRHGYIVIKVSGGSNATTGATAGLYFYEVQADLSNSYPTSLSYKGGIGDNVANFSISLSSGVLTVADAYTTFNNIICKVEFGVFTGNVGIT